MKKFFPAIYAIIVSCAFATIGNCAMDNPVASSNSFDLLGIDGEQDGLHHKQQTSAHQAPAHKPKNKPVHNEQSGPKTIRIYDEKYDVSFEFLIPAGKNKKAINEFDYTDTVKDWFNDEEGSLRAKGLLGNQASYQRNPGQSLTNKQSLYYSCFMHNYTQKVDKVILAYGNRRPHWAPEQNHMGAAILLPVSIFFREGVQTSATLCYLFNDKTCKHCYHRNIQ